jgi:Rrf2 family transcriptional regulator, cysteine metabolism repressor
VPRGVELLHGELGREATGIFPDAAKAARDVLDGTTLPAVIECEARESTTPMYYI